MQPVGPLTSSKKKNKLMTLTYFSRHRLFSLSQASISSISYCLLGALLVEVLGPGPPKSGIGTWTSFLAKLTRHYVKSKITRGVISDRQ